MTRGLFSLFIAILLMTGAIALSNPWRAHAASGQTAVTQACANGTVIASFSWQGNDPGAKEQWLDLSLFDNGWQPHSFMSAGPLSAATTTFSWAGLPSKVPFVIRVNQLLPDGTWDPSANSRFVSMDCAVAISSTVPTGQASPSATTPASNSSTSTTTGTTSTASSAASTAALPKLNLFSGPVPKGYDDKRPSQTIGYFLSSPGFDLDALKSQLVVTLTGPGGVVNKAVNVSSYGWTWDTSIPGGMTIWMNMQMPMASYTVNITLPNGVSGTAGFFHFVPTAG